MTKLTDVKALTPPQKTEFTGTDFAAGPDRIVVYIPGGRRGGYSGVASQAVERLVRRLREKEVKDADD